MSTRYGQHQRQQSWLSWSSSLSSTMPPLPSWNFIIKYVLLRIIPITFVLVAITRNIRISISIDYNNNNIHRNNLQDGNINDLMSLLMAGLTNTITSGGVGSIDGSTRDLTTTTYAVRSNYNSNNNKINKDRIPVSVTSPVYVVGLPKAGTTTIYEMFKCSFTKHHQRQQELQQQQDHSFLQIQTQTQQQTQQPLQAQHYCCCGSNSSNFPCNKFDKRYQRATHKQRRDTLLKSYVMSNCILYNLKERRNRTNDIFHNCGPAATAKTLPQTNEELSAPQEPYSYAFYGQLDAETKYDYFLPQVSHLNEIIESTITIRKEYNQELQQQQQQQQQQQHQQQNIVNLYDNVTFILNLRNRPKDWVKSTKNWFHMETRFLRYYGYFENAKRSRKERDRLLENIYNNHTQHIRNFVTTYNNNPHRRVHGINLIEVNISNPNSGRMLVDIFEDGILDESCWGKHNVNLRPLVAYEKYVKKRNKRQKQKQQQQQLENEEERTATEGEGGEGEEIEEEEEEEERTATGGEGGEGQEIEEEEEEGGGDMQI